MRQQKDEKDILATKMQLYQKWKVDYQKHQETAKKEQAYLKQKKQEMEKLWGEICTIYMQQLTKALDCEPAQLMEKLQVLQGTEIAGNTVKLPDTVSGSEDVLSREVEDDGT